MENPPERFAFGTSGGGAADATGLVGFAVTGAGGSSGGTGGATGASKTTVGWAGGGATGRTDRTLGDNGAGADAVAVVSGATAIVAAPAAFTVRAAGSQSTTIRNGL